MLDEKTEKVLEKIIRLCSDGYKVLVAEDFDSPEGLDETVGYLSDRGYVSLRYHEKEDYLVMPLAKGRSYFEQKYQDLALRGILCRKAALYSFIGGLCGGGVVALICFILGWLL